MRTVPDRPASVHVLTVLGCFFLGPVLGILLSTALTPDSVVIQAFAPFAYAGIFFFGVLAWVGLGIVALVLALVRGVFSRKAREKIRSSAQGRMVPPGYRSFVVLGGLVGGVLGLAGAWLSSGTVATVAAPFFGVGRAYGALLWASAHHGYLPFPDDD